MPKPPPPALGSERVLAYAFVDRTVTYTGQQRLYVDGELLGAVPRIAIGKSLSEELKDYLILYCDKNWNQLGVSGAPTMPRALEQVEQYYRGISSRFVRTNCTERQARKWIVENHPNAACSFCKRLYFECDKMIESRTATICSTCVQDFARLLDLSGEPAPPASA